MRSVPIRVNGELLDESLIEAESKVIRPYLSEQMAASPRAEMEERLRKWAQENAIERLLLRQAALADTEPVPEAAASAWQLNGSREEAVSEAELQFRVERLVTKNAGRIAVPKPKDVIEYYRKHRDEMLIPERAHAAHIVKNIDSRKDEATALAEIQEIEAELKAGAVFEELADRASDCPGGGGDLGWFPRGEMVDEFENAVFSLSAGGLSGTFRTPFGFHIAKLYEIAPEHQAGLEEVREQIEETLLAEKRKKALDRLLDHLRASAVIEREA